MYLLFTGNIFNFEKGIADGMHVRSGLVGVFVLKQTGNGWKLFAAQPHGWAGLFGNASEAKPWPFHEFGKDEWGFLILHSDVHNDYVGSTYQSFAHDGTKKATRSSIMAEVENMRVSGGCSENSYKDRKNTTIERRKRLSELYNPSSRIKILKDSKASAGFYLLQLTVSGFDGPRKYTNKVFTATYNSAKGYRSTLGDHPPVDKDFWFFKRPPIF